MVCGTCGSSTASLDDLLEPSSGRSFRRSILNGDYFIDEVVEKLCDLQRSASSNRTPGAPGGHLPRQPPSSAACRSSDAADPLVRDPRRKAYFHFRHLAALGARATSTTPMQRRPWLGVAARSSVLVPAAFEPYRSICRATRAPYPAASGRTPPNSASTTVGSSTTSPSPGRSGRAAASPAQDAVRRWVIFLHPAPSVDSGRTKRVVDDRPIDHRCREGPRMLGRRRKRCSTTWRCSAAHNRSSESIRLQRLSLCERAFASCGSDAACGGTGDRSRRTRSSSLTSGANLARIPIGGHRSVGRRSGAGDDRVSSSACRSSGARRDRR